MSCGKRSRSSPASRELGSALAPGPRRNPSGSLGVSGRWACVPIAGACPELPLQVARSRERGRARCGAQHVRARAPQRREARWLKRSSVASISECAFDALAWYTCRAGPRAGGSGINGLTDGNGGAGRSSGGVSSSSSSTLLRTCSNRSTKRLGSTLPSSELYRVGEPRSLVSSLADGVREYRERGQPELRRVHVLTRALREHRGQARG
jgi:hypothetical protein